MTHDICDIPFPRRIHAAVQDVPYKAMPGKHPLFLQLLAGKERVQAVTGMDDEEWLIYVAAASFLEPDDLGYHVRVPYSALTRRVSLILAGMHLRAGEPIPPRLIARLNGTNRLN